MSLACEWPIENGDPEIGVSAPEAASTVRASRNAVALFVLPAAYTISPVGLELDPPPFPPVPPVPPVPLPLVPPGVPPTGGVGPAPEAEPADPPHPRSSMNNTNINADEEAAAKRRVLRRESTVAPSCFREGTQEKSHKHCHRLLDWQPRPSQAALYTVCESLIPRTPSN